MGPTSPAARGLDRHRGPPPLPLLLPLLLLLLRAQLAVGSLAGGSPGAAEVRPGRVLGDAGRGGTGPWIGMRTRPGQKAQSFQLSGRPPYAPNGTRHS